jgi:hypothetical protein
MASSCLAQKKVPIPYRHHLCLDSIVAWNTKTGEKFSHRKHEKAVLGIVVNPFKPQFVTFAHEGNFGVWTYASLHVDTSMHVDTWMDVDTVPLSASPTALSSMDTTAYVPLQQQCMATPTPVYAPVAPPSAPPTISTSTPVLLQQQHKALTTPAAPPVRKASSDNPSKKRHVTFEDEKQPSPPSVYMSKRVRCNEPPLEVRESNPKLVCHAIVPSPM